MDPSYAPRLGVLDYAIRVTETHQRKPRRETSSGVIFKESGTPLAALVVLDFMSLQHSDIAQPAV